jgi:hypothetical protein
MNLKKRPTKPASPPSSDRLPPGEIRFSPKVVEAAEKSAGRRLRYDVEELPPTNGRRD